MAGETRNYLISFLARIQGHKAVTKGLKTIQSQTAKVAQTQKVATKATSAFHKGLEKAIALAGRSFLIIPIWMAMRSVMMGVIRTIGDMIRATIDLEEGMARIKTVVSASSTSIDTDMKGIRRTILDTALKTRISIKELAETFYFLRTSNLDTNEAMQAFIPTLNAMVGTGNKGQQTARALAGIYNTMGKQLGDTLTVHEKFQKIADTLTFTYATQDVQLSELISGYEKLAPFLTGLDDSFTDIVTTIGFLNTRMLRGGRTGRLLGRSILQLTKNSKKLAGTLGITFDPDKPIRFLNVIKQISNRLSTTTKLTARQGQILQEVFATRGGVPIRLLVQDLNELVTALENAGAGSEGFAENMRAIREATPTAQAERLKNILAVMTAEFGAGAVGADALTLSLTALNTNLENSFSGIQSLGRVVGFAGYNIAQLILITEELKKALNIKVYGLNDLISQIALGGLALNQFVEEANTDTPKGFENFIKTIKEMKLGIKNWEEYNVQMDKIIEKSSEEANIRKSITKSEKEFQTQKIKNLKEEKSETKRIIDLMKARGSNELDIARFRLESLKNLESLMTEEEHLLALKNAQNKVLEEEIKYRKQITVNLQQAQLGMLKTIGFSELDTLKAKQKQLELSRTTIGETQYLLELDKLRVKQALALAKEKTKERDTLNNLILQYAKADALEQGRIERLLELQRMPIHRIAQKFQESMYDKQIIEQYWNSFGKEAQNAITNLIARREARFFLREPELTVTERAPSITDEFGKIQISQVNRYWDYWLKKARETMTKLPTVLPTGVTAPTVPGAGKVSPATATFAPQLTTSISQVKINLPIDSLDRLSDEVGKQFALELKNNPKFAKMIAELLRSHI